LDRGIRKRPIGKSESRVSRENNVDNVARQAVETDFADDSAVEITSDLGQVVKNIEKR
jgi:hypothetical protein